MVLRRGMSVRENFLLILPSPAHRPTKSSITATIASLPPSRSYNELCMALAPSWPRPKLCRRRYAGRRGGSMLGEECSYLGHDHIRAGKCAEVVLAGDDQRSG